MARVTPYNTGFEIDDSQLNPGAIFRKIDGSVWKVNADGSQSPWGTDSGGAWGEASTAQFSGSGSPVGVVTPSGEGDLYVDETTPALWQATGATSADWQQVGGGGSVPGVMRTLRFAFAFDDVGLADGIEAFTPAVGDIIDDIYFERYTAWDGMTPTGDFGTLAPDPTGILANILAAADMTEVDDDPGSAGLAMSNALTSFSTVMLDSGGGGGGGWQLRVTEAIPIKYVVSVNGEAGGDDPGASQGSAALVVKICTPATAY